MLWEDIMYYYHIHSWLGAAAAGTFEEHYLVFLFILETFFWGHFKPHSLGI